MILYSLVDGVGIERAVAVAVHGSKTVVHVHMIVKKIVALNGMSTVLMFELLYVSDRQFKVLSRVKA